MTGFTQGKILEGENKLMMTLRFSACATRRMEWSLRGPIDSQLGKSNFKREVRVRDIHLGVISI